MTGFFCCPDEEDRKQSDWFPREGPARIVTFVVIEGSLRVEDTQAAQGDDLKLLGTEDHEKDVGP